MEIEVFLNNLFEDGHKHGFFHSSTIGQLDKSCCTLSKTEVIDFDKTKEYIVKEKGFVTVKSCESVKIIASLKRIDFIELKGFRQFIRFNPSSSTQKAQQQIEKYDLLTKIKESDFILNSIVLSKEFQYSPTARQKYIDVHKYFIIVTDISPQKNSIESIAASLDFLANFSTPIEYQIFEMFGEHIQNIRKDVFANFKDTLLIPCENLDEFYERLTP